MRKFHVGSVLMALLLVFTVSLLPNCKKEGGDENMQSSPSDTIYWIVEGIEVSNGNVKQPVGYNTVEITGDISKLVASTFRVIDHGHVVSSITDRPSLEDNEGFSSLGSLDNGETGAFTSIINGLREKETYYARAYIKREVLSTGKEEVGYHGYSISFNTTEIASPNLQIGDPSNVTTNSFTIDGKINDPNLLELKKYGHIISKNPVDLDLTTNTFEDSTDLGQLASVYEHTFLSSFDGLEPGATYYVRAYAINQHNRIGQSEIVAVNTESINPIMVSIPQGVFTMGCTPGDPTCHPQKEFPRHDVSLNTYLIGITEVTQQQWTAIMGSNPIHPEDCLDCPIDNVSWYDAIVFCNRLSEQNGFIPCYYSDIGYTQVYGKSGQSWSLPNSGTVYWRPNSNGFRLPTEAEWERAARSGVSSDIYSGGNNINAVAWYSGNTTRTRPVGFKPLGGTPNFGLFDMSGNVWEWCWDRFDPQYYLVSPSSNPIGPPSGDRRSIRGGAFRHVAVVNRVSGRNDHAPDDRAIDFGFRVARTQ